jgi:alkylation response protein AidB-like acyl-CoA dehydrogenase
VNFAFNEEQEQLRQLVRKFLDDQSPVERVMEVMEADVPIDEPLWAQMAEQLGLQALAIPEELGGSGYGFLELVVVFEEMGRRLPCVPFFSTIALGATALLHCGDEAAQKEHLPAIASGELTATLALTEGDARWDPDSIQFTATDHGDGWSLTGTKTHVIDGATAGLVLVAARTGNGISLFAVEGATPGLTRETLTPMDLTRPLATLTFDGTPARLVGREGEAWPGLVTTLRLAVVALAAEQVGGAQQCLESAVQYAKERIQFGRPIGSFQAVKHLCADMLVLVESARSAAYYAGWAAAEMDDDLPVAASMAKAYCSDAYTWVAGQNIQVHGGIGFTWEHPAHLYFKRAKSSELLFGDPAHHRELLAQALDI